MPEALMQAAVRVDTARLERELEKLAAFTPAGEPGAVTRVVFSPEDMAAREYVTTLARELELEVRADAVGNTFFRWQGSQPELAAVATGSHIDAIPNAGRYDGTVGVLGGLAAVRALQAAGFKPVRSIEVILFTSEEPTRFGIGCLGSRLLAGALGAEADALQDAGGVSLRQAREAAGFAGELASVRLGHGHYRAFVELHIEQGPELEQAGLDLGFVTGIAAPASARILVTGEGGHAGALPMPARRDALTAASELILAVEAAARNTGAEDTVATVGQCEVFPGAMNSVPSRVQLSLDVRDTDQARRDQVLEAIARSADEIAGRRKVEIAMQMLNRDAPATCAEEIVFTLEHAAAEAGARGRRMVSRAYHDTLFLAQVCPVGMLFVPCRGGVSHRPDEFVAPAQVALGVEVLARTLARLSSL